MKKLVLTICLLVGMLMVQGCVTQESYVRAGGGTGIVTVETGQVDGKVTTGIGFVTVARREEIQRYSRTRKYESSIDGYTRHYTRKAVIPAEYGLYARYGIEIMDDSHIFLSVFGGGTFCRETKVNSFYPNDHPEYKTKEESALYPLYGIGISYIPPIGTGFTWSIDYGNRTELTGSLGWLWKF